MNLGNLIKSASKNYAKIPVDGISFDSRKVKKNYIFFAIDGYKNNGVKYIDDAILRGSSAIICEKKFKNIKSTVPLIPVKNIRKSLSEACSKFYKRNFLNIIAVTGTNGKSSVADFFYQILSFNNVSAASIGTLGIKSKIYKKKIDLTSLDPLSLHKNLQILSKKNIKHVILEASSHGLKQSRLDNLNIKTGVFTNLSHDHLDYHKNMKSYFEAKMYLFKNLMKKNSTIITDEDNKEFKVLKSIANKRKLKKITMGMKSGNIKILNNKYNENKQIVKILVDSKILNFQVPLIGFFQIKNLIMAILVALNCGLNKKKIFNQISKIKAVEGRLECIVNLKNNSNVIVDFAHTPDALEQSLIAIKKQFKKEIILVFGCGGDRDKKKRSIMGKIAKKYCRKIFVTDDNPRNENPKKIRKQIIKGCKRNAIDIGDRKKAIKKAITELRSNEILLVAGKGHEKTQDYGSKIINFSDKKVIQDEIKKRKNYFKKISWPQFFAEKTFKNKNINNLNYNGVSINSKTIKKNNLFFAIRGKKTDGHNFANEAIKKGAITSVISKKVKKLSKNKTINVKNTLSSLNKLAYITRYYSCAKIIGVTGSVGKTSLKNLIGYSLENYGKVHNSPHSYNNKFGVPLTLSNLKKNVDYGVFEIGMDKKGEINYLSNMVKPEIAIITNISEAHLKNFRTIKDIALAKGEIINNITKNGNIILNKDDKFFNLLSKKARKNKVNVISFSKKQKADVFLTGIKKNRNYYTLKVNVRDKIFNFSVKYSTDSFISNILACVSVIFILNLNLTKLKNKFLNFKIPEGRGDIKIVKKFNKKFKFIDESYNANPLSMKSAIKNMNHHEKNNNQKKFIFLSDMLELGKKSRKLHRKLSRFINSSDIDKVFVYGNYIKETYKYLNTNKKGKIFKDIKEAHNHFSKILHNNDILMVKGSNATGLNLFSKNIKKGQIGAL
tara:strand:+ start:5773 stop:8622 length:2850 start_codon:yes stop_codon:yes gene_type:complete